MEINPPREEPASTATHSWEEVMQNIARPNTDWNIGRQRVILNEGFVLEVGGKDVTFAPADFVEMKEMLEWWRRVRSPVSFHPSVGSEAPTGPNKKVWLQFDDGTKSQEAIRAMWITDADGQMHKMDADSMTKLVEMMEWYNRVHEPSVTANGADL